MVSFNAEFLEETNRKYRVFAGNFSKEDTQYNLDRLSFREKLIGFMTPEYYKREKLFLRGNVVYGFIYRTFQSSNENGQVQLWVITSPEHIFTENPMLLADVSEKLSSIIINKKYEDRGVQAFVRRIHEPYAEVKYLEIPGVFTDNHLAFLSSVMYKTNHVASFRHGINLFISAPNISKELLLLPERYWSDQYTEWYYRDSNKEQSVSK